MKKSNIIFLLSENVGILEGQEGCGFLSEYTGFDADVLVSFDSVETNILGNTFRFLCGKA